MNTSKPLCIVALASLLLAPPSASADVWVAADGALAKVAADGRILLTIDSVFGRSFSYCAGPDNIIAVDQRSGHVWIADINNNRLIELSAGGQPLREIAVVSPTALAIAPDSSAMWVAVLLDQRPAVIKVDQSSGDTRVRVTGFANSVFALDVGPSGRVWIGDRFNNEVVILSGTDDELDGSDVSAAVGPHHRRVGGFDEILDLAVAPTDDVASQESSWVADRGHAEAVKIQADGTELIRVHPTSFFQMNYVSVDRGDGSAWVADPNSSRLAKLTPLGNETLNQPVAFPTALAVDTADNAVWLGTGFFDDARLRKLDSNGAELLAVGGFGGLNTVCGIGVEPHLTVTIDGCDSGVPNAVLPDGVTISDHIGACAADARNHGQFIRCVAHVTHVAAEAGAIAGKQKGKIQSCAARARIP